MQISVKSGSGRLAESLTWLCTSSAPFPLALSRCLCQLFSPGSLGIARVMVMCGGSWHGGGRGPLGCPLPTRQLRP